MNYEDHYSCDEEEESQPYNAGNEPNVAGMNVAEYLTDQHHANCTHQNDSGPNETEAMLYYSDNEDEAAPNDGNMGTTTGYAPHQQYYFTTHSDIGLGYDQPTVYQQFTATELDDQSYYTEICTGQSNVTDFNHEQMTAKKRQKGVKKRTPFRANKTDILPTVTDKQFDTFRSAVSLPESFKVAADLPPSQTTTDSAVEPASGEMSSSRSDTGYRAANSIISGIIRSIIPGQQEQDNERPSEQRKDSKTRGKGKPSSVSSVGSSICPKQSPRTSSRISKWIDNLASISDVSKIIEDKEEFTFPTSISVNSHVSGDSKRANSNSGLEKGLTKPNVSAETGSKDCCEISDDDSVSQVGRGDGAVSEVTSLVPQNNTWLRRRPGANIQQKPASWFTWNGPDLRSSMKNSTSATYAGPLVPAAASNSPLKLASADMNDIPDGKHYFKIIETTTQKSKFGSDGSQTVDIVRTLEQEERVETDKPTTSNFSYSKQSQMSWLFLPALKLLALLVLAVLIVAYIVVAVFGVNLSVCDRIGGSYGVTMMTSSDLNQTVKA